MINSTCQIQNFSLHLWDHFTYHQMLPNSTLQMTTLTIDSQLVLSFSLNFPTHFIYNQMLPNSTLQMTTLTIDSQIVLSFSLNFPTHFIYNHTESHTPFSVLTIHVSVNSNCLYAPGATHVKIFWSVNFFANFRVPGQIEAAFLLLSHQLSAFSSHFHALRNQNVLIIYTLLQNSKRRRSGAPTVHLRTIEVIHANYTSTKRKFIRDKDSI